MKHLPLALLSLLSACGPTAATPKPCEQFRARVESGRVAAASSQRSVMQPLPDMAASIVYNLYIDDANAITVTTDAPDAALCHAAATSSLNFVGVAATDKNGDWLDSSSSEAGLWYDVPQRVLEGGLPRTHDGVGIDGLVPAFARSALLIVASVVEAHNDYFEIRDTNNRVALLADGGSYLQAEINLAKGRSFTYFIGGVADKLYVDVTSARW